MKNLLLFLPAVLLCTALHAQNPTTWFPPGATWKYQYESLSGPGQQVLESVGTAVKGGQLCTKLHKFGYHQGWPPGPFDSGFEYVYAKNDSVFRWTGNLFKLLYDFTRQPGDTIVPPNGLYDIGVVDATGQDTVTPGIPVRYQDIRLINYANFGDTFVYPTRVYERIGGEHLLHWDEESPLTEIQYFLVCYRDDEFPQSTCTLSYDPGYVGFPTGPATWSEETSFWCGYSGYQYQTGTDTVIWGVGQGKKVFYRPTYSGTDPCLGGPVTIYHEPFQLIGLLDQNIFYKKVYFTRLTTDDAPFPVCLDLLEDDPLPVGQTVILYDFDLHVGDTVSWRPAPNVVLAIDSIQLNDGSWRRRFQFETDQYYTWIEGIGSSLGLFNSYAKPILDIGCALHCFRDNGVLKYNIVDAVFCDSVTVGTNEPVAQVPVELYPNPSAGVVRLELPTDAMPVLLRIFDAQGRQLEVQERSTAPVILDVSAWSGADLLFLHVLDRNGRMGRGVLRVEH